MPRGRRSNYLPRLRRILQRGYSGIWHWGRIDLSAVTWPDPRAAETGQATYLPSDIAVILTIEPETNNMEDVLLLDPQLIDIRAARAAAEEQQQSFSPRDELIELLEPGEENRQSQERGGLRQYCAQLWRRSFRCVRFLVCLLWVCPRPSTSTIVRHRGHE